ncbi:MAG: hypothetical protein HRU06_11920 [Oceanospirillaceae bacterium]|nr:hypothetical protein [Oceanospirillaceae bacterium]
MFIKIKKKSGLYMEHNGLEKRHLVPVTSNFLINLEQVAEVSFYTIKENKIRFDLEDREFRVPVHTRVIHLQMAYPYAQVSDVHSNNKTSLVQRCYYKFYCLPEEDTQYEVLRSKIEEFVLNL